MLESALAHSAFLLKNLFLSDKKQTCVLVGGFNPSEKYEFVNWDDEIIPNTWKNVPNHQP